MNDNQEPIHTDVAEPIAAPEPMIVVPPVEAVVEAVATPEPVAPVAPTVPTQSAQRKPTLIVGQTTNLGVRERDLVSPPALEFNITDGPASCSNVTIDMEYTTPPVPLHERKDLDTSSREITLFLSERSPEADLRIRSLVSPMALKSGRGADWNDTIVGASMRTSYIDGRFGKTVQRPGSHFKQFLQTESTKLGFTAPSVKESSPGSGYTGEKAVLRVRSILGLGGIVSVPLWHSGFWVTLTTPEEGALIELMRRLQEEKIELGRETFGLVFSNEQSYTNSFLLDFVLEHVIEHTVKVDSVNDLRSLIKIQDLNILFWGMACLVWPRGFDYVRSLTTREGIENTETISAKINVGKLMWIDNASFDDRQRAHMLNKQRGQMPVDRIKEYQSNFIPSLAGGRRVSIRENLEIIIDSTDVANYILDGAQWIQGIVQTVDSTFTQAPPTEQDRNRMIATHSRANKLRNYGAWVKTIIVDGAENTEREDIVKILDVLSVDDEISELIETEITKFIDDATRALIAIPETSGKDTGVPRFQNLIPIDVVNTFFTLLAQRVNIISRR